MKALKQANKKTTDNQHEMFIVVDENDHIVGYKTRAECHSRCDLIHRSTHVLIFNDNAELLLQKRSMTKDKSPGMWTVSASGHVTKGQTYKKAAERELKEEVGIKALLRHIGTYLYKGDEEQEMTAVFKSVHEGPFILQKEEVDEVRFIAIETLATMKDKITDHGLETLERFKLL